MTSETLSKYEGDTVTLSSSLSGTFTFPEWRGPPSFTAYTNQDDTTGAINPIAPAGSRLQYASNNKDLILSKAVTNDSGEYKCSYTGLGDHTITLTVNPVPAEVPAEAPDEAPAKAPAKGCWTWWKILLVICFCCLMVLFVVGFILFYLYCLKD